MSKEDLGNYLLQKTTNKRILISCHLDLTYQCNLDCVHCFVVKENRKEMNTSKIFNIIDELANMGTLYLSLSGGEIFIREDFFKIAEYARKKNFALNISTNGTCIDESIAEKISNLNPYQIHISVYSLNPEIHDKITGIPGSLKKTMKAVKMLKNKNVSISISNTIMKQNINEYSKVYEMAKNLGLEFRFDPQITPKINGDRIPLDNQVDEEGLHKIYSDPVFKLNLSETKKSKNDSDDLLCGAGHTTCYISPYGDVFPCVQFPVLCGNINDDPLEEIWYKSPEMVKVSNLRKSIMPTCSNCEILEHCHYCPGLSILEENSLLTPPKRCCAQAELLNNLKR